MFCKPDNKFILLAMMIGIIALIILIPSLSVFGILLLCPLMHVFGMHGVKHKKGKKKCH